MAPPSSLPPLKKRKKTIGASGSGSGSSSSKVAQILTFEKHLTSSPADLNPIIEILSILKSATATEPEVVHKAIWVLHRVFSRVLSEEAEVAKRGEQGVKEVRKWVRERLEEYVQVLGGLLQDDEKDLRQSALSLLLSLLAPLSDIATYTTVPPRPQYNTQHLRAVAKFLLFSPPSFRQSSTSETNFLIPDILLSLKEKIFLQGNWDVRWGFLKECAVLCRPYLPSKHRQEGTEVQIPPKELSVNLLSILEVLPPIPATAKEMKSFYLPSLSAKPPSAGPASTEKAKKEGDEDDWRTYFDSDSEDSDDEAGPSKSSNKKGAKGKGKKAAGEKPAKRVYALSVWESVHSVDSQRAIFTEVWMAVLTLGMDANQARRILLILHHSVLPSMVKIRAVHTADWLSEWVDKGGPLGLLALNSLFVLIRDYNLDYPDFYTRLYSFLDRGVLHGRYRGRFFRLMDVFLSSTHLPANLIASFIKRLARLSLSASPSGIVMVIPFIYNLLKVHPGCMVMIHRDVYGNGVIPEGKDGEVIFERQIGEDLYDATALDPLDSKAIDSSLWELSTLQSHYSSSISTMAKIFSEVFTKPKFGMEDFLDHTYSTLFETETKRKLKKDPALAISPIDAAAFFPTRKVATTKRPRSGDEDDEEGDKDVAVDVVGGDIVSELWTFGDKAW